MNKFDVRIDIRAPNSKLFPLLKNLNGGRVRFLAYDLTNHKKYIEPNYFPDEEKVKTLFDDSAPNTNQQNLTQGLSQLTFDPTFQNSWDDSSVKVAYDEAFKQSKEVNILKKCSGALGLRVDWFRNAEQQPDCDASGYVTVFFQKKLVLPGEYGGDTYTSYTVNVISGLELELEVILSEEAVRGNVDLEDEKEKMKLWWKEKIEEPIQEQQEMLNAFQQMLADEKHRRKPAIMGTYSERFADMAHMSVAPMIEGNFLPHVHFAQHWIFEPDMLMELLEMALEMTTYPR